MYVCMYTCILKVLKADFEFLNFIFSDSHHFPDKPTHYSTLHATPPSSSREPNH